MTLSCVCVCVCDVCLCYVLSLSLSEEWAEKVALLKCKCFASVFHKYFQLQRDGHQKETAIIHYRDRETMLVRGCPCLIAL